MYNCLINTVAQHNKTVLTLLPREQKPDILCLWQKNILINIFYVHIKGSESPVLLSELPYIICIPLSFLPHVCFLFSYLWEWNLLFSIQPISLLLLLMPLT